MPRTRSSGPIRTVWVALLLCMLAMRVVVPQGFMWSNDANGPHMVMCSGTMPAPIAPAMARAMRGPMPHGGHDGKAIEHPCAFAAASAAVDVTAAVHPANGHFELNEAPIAAYRSARPGLGLAAPPPPKTGPPLLA